MTLRATQIRDEQRQADVQRLLDEGSDLQRLAALPSIEYDRVRAAEAERIGCRVTTLDTEVARLRDDKPQAEARAPFAAIELWPKPVDGATLLNDLIESAQRHLALPDHAGIALALWSVFSHVIDGAEAAPILAVTAPEKRCGKTTLLGWLAALVARPLPASNITAAALFRAIEKWHPTLLIDEADTFLRASDELRGVINSGHTRRTAYVIRTAGDDHDPKCYDTWSAKAIAMIGTLPDTIADRSIHIEMRRRLPHESIESMRDASRHLGELARKIARWSADNIDGIRAARPSMPSGLHDRAVDNWQPLIAIADAAGGGWPAHARAAAVALTGRGDGASIGPELLADIRTIFELRHVDRISTSDLIEALTQDEESPWPTWNHGKPISPRQIAKRLREFGITSNQTIRIGLTTAKGYQLAQFADVFERYIPESVTRLQPNDDAGFSESEPVTSSRDVTKVTGSKPSSDAACHRVTDSEEEY